MWPYLLFGLYCLVPAGVIALVVAVFRARKNASATPIVRIALIISTVWAGLALLGAIVITWLWFTPNSYPFFSLQTQSFWPAPNPMDVTSADPDSIIGVVTGGFTSAQISASGLSLGTRLLLASGGMLGSLVTVALAGLVALACLRFMQGRPFAPELARLSMTAALVALVGGVASQALLWVGGSRAAREIIAAGMAPAGLEAASGVDINWWPLALAIGLGVFSALIRYGSVMQRDTEGLV